MDTLKLWNAIKHVPPEAQKKIMGGRLSGMTDISPMWRYLELTRHFGPCGIGWKYTIDKLWLENGEPPTVCAFAQITLYIANYESGDGEWSDGIPGIGGSTFVALEKNGIHTSDEAYKMAVTDALSVACKVLGMGADVYWFAGSKYSCPQNEQKPTNKPSEHHAPSHPIARPDGLERGQLVTSGQLIMLRNKMEKAVGSNPADIAHIEKELCHAFNLPTLNDLAFGDVDKAIKFIVGGDK